MPKQKLKSMAPSITLRSCYTSYYIHDNHIYPIAGSSSEIFTSAVHQLVPRRWDDTAEKVLQSRDIDLTARWYILNRLAEKHTPMKLYTSRFEAERAISKQPHF